MGERRVAAQRSLGEQVTGQYITNEGKDFAQSPRRSGRTRAFKAPAFLTNGFLGLRPGPVPLLADPFAGAPAPKAGSFDPTVPATFAGFRYRGVSLHEVPAPGPYPFATAVLVDGRDVLRAADARAVPISQTLDMATGELRTQLELPRTGTVRLVL